MNLFFLFTAAVVAICGLMIVFGIARMFRTQRHIRSMVDRELERMAAEDPGEATPSRECPYCGRPTQGAQSGDSCETCGGRFD